jgi:two-component system sensor histidine kinase BaeS
MKQRLLWKLLLINIVPVIGIIILVVWLAIDQLAAGYFMALMDKYEVSPNDIHQMFLTAVHRYLLWATVAALALAFLISYFLIRRVLQPLSQMHTLTREVAAGNFSARVDVISQDEVGELGVAFNRMADSLEQVEQLRKTMVADVAHELRTPLTNLRGYLEALNDRVLPPSQETFTMLQQEIMRLVSLVENLQQLARADAARVYLKREKLSLAEIVDQILSLYRLPFQEKKALVPGLSLSWLIGINCFRPYEIWWKMVGNIHRITAGLLSVPSLIGARSNFPSLTAGPVYRSLICLLFLNGFSGPTGQGHGMAAARVSAWPLSGN